jgi:hypothetical protein
MSVNIPDSILNGQVVDPKTGMFTPLFQRWWRENFQRTLPTLTTQGEFVNTAPVQGRPEGIGTTVQNVDSNGVVTAPGVDLSRDYTNKNLGHIPDDPTSDRNAVTVDQRTGGGRGFVAIDTNNNVPVEHNTPANQLGATNFCLVNPIDAGASASIQIYGPAGVGTSWNRPAGDSTLGPYPSGNIAGLAYSTKYAVMFNTLTSTFLAATTVPDTLANYLIYCGTVTTPPSGGGTVAVGTAVMSGVSPNEVVTAVNISSAGSGYTTAPAVTFNGGGTPTRVATGYATLNGSGGVAAVVMTDQGEGYSATPTVDFSGGQTGTSGGGGTSGGTGGRYADMDL